MKKWVLWLKERYQARRLELAQLDYLAEFDYWKRRDGNAIVTGFRTAK